LFARFRKLFDDNVTYFLRTHDFGGSFSGHFFKVLDAISADWVGPRYQFEDPEMAKIWSELFVKNRQLLKMMAQYTTRVGNDWCQPHWVHEDWHSEETNERVKLMNDLATELVELVDKLEAEARKKWISVPPTQALKGEAAN